MESYPFERFYLQKLGNKFRELLGLIKIETVIAKILSDEYKLLYSCICKISSFTYKLFHRPRNVLSPDSRNSTEGTAAVASFRYFQVCVVSGTRNLALESQVIAVLNTQFIKNVINIIDAEVPFYPGDLGFKIVHVTFSEAAHYIKIIYIASFPCPDIFKNCVDTFFLCIVNESAGINYD